MKKATTPTRSLIGEAGLRYACDVIHNEVFVASEILIPWLSHALAPLYATEGIHSSQRLEYVR